jgi:hypothetical protein
MDTPNPTNDGPRLVTVPHFVNHMLGIKSVSWFYKHQDDPDLPKQIYPSGPNGPARLLYEDCLRYLEILKTRGGRFGSSAAVIMAVALSACLYCSSHTEATGMAGMDHRHTWHDDYIPFWCLIDDWYDGR